MVKQELSDVLHTVLSPEPGLWIHSVRAFLPPYGGATGPGGPPYLISSRRALITHGESSGRRRHRQDARKTGCFHLGEGISGLLSPNPKEEMAARAGLALTCPKLRLRGCTGGGRGVQPVLVADFLEVPDSLPWLG